MQSDVAEQPKNAAQDKNDHNTRDGSNSEEVPLVEDPPNPQRNNPNPRKENESDDEQETYNSNPTLDGGIGSRNENKSTLDSGIASGNENSSSQEVTEVCTYRSRSIYTFYFHTLF